MQSTASNSDRLVCAKLTSMNTPHDNPQHSPDPEPANPSRRSFTEENQDGPDAAEQDVRQQMRDISEVAAVEVIVTSAVHLMSAAAVKCGLGHEENAEQLKDLDEARKLITALAGFVTAAAPEIGSQHAGPLRDGLRSLQLAFREASIIPDPPGKGPGEKYTGPVN
ncbi:MAG: sugar phosphate isomerase [Micrococcaceae bacterium]|nr:sugar phosphate isomerase [Micrococcaceae bacterium]